MNLTEILNQVDQIAERATEKAEEYSGVFGTAREFIVCHFGQNGLLAAYLAMAVLVLVAVSKLIGVTFSALKYLVLPAIALAFLASLFLSFSFITALPVTVTICSLVLLFKE